MGTPAWEADVAAAAALLADRTRVAFLLALGDGRALPAGELARRARVAPSTASAHLVRLVDQGVLALERSGRHRYYRLAGPAVVRAIEALAVFAPPAPVRTLRESGAAAAVRAARTCYDHLAGALGVAVTQALVSRGLLDQEEDGYAVTPEGEARFRALGVDLGALRTQRRHFAPHCLDWSERRHHVAGALGAALTRRYFDLGWLARRPTSRAVSLTYSGRDGFGQWLGVRL